MTLERMIPLPEAARKLGLSESRLRRMAEIGRKEWKEESDYHRRSLAETAMFRFKTIFGDHLDARETQRQKSEARIKCAALNRMTRLGMPDSYRIK